MILLIFSLIFGITASNDVVKNLSDAVFAPANNPIKITRVHYNADMDEMFSEYIYKNNDRIRIDADYGDSTITTFVYDGKSGFVRGRDASKIASLETVLYCHPCGYLSTIEKVTVSYFQGSDALLASGRQGNKLFIDYNTFLPIQYEVKNKTVEFKKYEKVEAFGKLPFLVIKSGKNGIFETIKITNVERLIALPANYFSLPRQKTGVIVDY